MLVTCDGCGKKEELELQAMARFPRPWVKVSYYGAYAPSTGPSIQRLVVLHACCTACVDVMMGRNHVPDVREIRIFGGYSPSEEEG